MCAHGVQFQELRVILKGPSMDFPVGPPHPEADCPLLLLGFLRMNINTCGKSSVSLQIKEMQIETLKVKVNIDKTLRKQKLREARLWESSVFTVNSSKWLNVSGDRKEEWKNKKSELIPLHNKQIRLYAE